MLFTESIRRVRLARTVLEKIPETSIKLDSWYTELAEPTYSTDCGTIACGAGWLSLSTEFNELGLISRQNGFEFYPSIQIDDYSLNGVPYRAWITGFKALNAVFGIAYTNRLFSGRGFSSFDKFFPINDRKLSDKQLLLDRIDMWLALNETTS